MTTRERLSKKDERVLVNLEIEKYRWARNIADTEAEIRKLQGRLVEYQSRFNAVVKSIDEVRGKERV